MQTVENWTSYHPPETDSWEAGYFDENCEGKKLKEPLMGIRVNGGTWIEFRALLRLIDEVEDATG